MSHAAKLLQTAMSHHQAGRLGDAEDAYRNLLRLETANADGLRLLGGLYLQAGDIPSALDYLARATLLLPHDAETLTNFGIALSASGRKDEAIDLYDRALRADERYVKALTNKGSLFQEAGRIVEAMDAFGKALRFSPDVASAHFNYANVLAASGRMREAIERYEYALRVCPDYLEAMINLGMSLSQIGKGEQSQQWLGLAQSWFRKALAKDPSNAVALNNMGNVLRQQGKASEATAYYRRALDVRPDYGQAALNMSTSLRDLSCYDEALEKCELAMRLLPDSSDARINHGALLQDLSRHEDAISQFDHALLLKPESLDARWNKSLSLLSLGRYAEGWELHETGLGVAHMRGEYPSPDRRWHGENFFGKRLLIWCEQGLGDSLQFVRYAELCKERGGEVIVQCPRALRTLFRRCPFIDVLPERIEEKDFDVHVPMMSLPFVFETRLETIPAHIPYLFVGDEARAKWALKFGPKLKKRVGLVWAGNPRDQQINAHLIDKRRSMELEDLRPLFDVPGVEFYNLQLAMGTKLPNSSDLHERMIDLMSEVQDFEDTAAIVENLDLVISVDTSVVHLAGGLGKSVWVLSRYGACWRWLQNAEKNPWYPSALIFGQPSPGNWADTIGNVKNELYKASMTTNAWAHG